jgi:hypothetical protein
MSTAVNETVNLTGGGGALSGSVTEDDLYAPDIGLVRTTVTASSSGGLSTERHDLLEYRTAHRASAAPAVLAVTPTQSQVRGATLSVSTTFTESMDAGTLNAGGFTVVDGNNQPVGGTVQTSGNNAIFTPAQPWVSGNFTATVGLGAKDLVGNAVAAARSWSFGVDATSPGLVSSTPAAGAQEVPLTTQIALLFSEPLAASTVNAGSVTVVDQGGNPVAGAATLGSDGATVSFTLGAPLARRQSYNVSVSTAVTDLIGNPVSPVAFGFRTDQGRFAEPVSLAPALPAFSAAFGDVNSDGIEDVLFTVVPSAGSPLAVMYGRGDGTLSAPTLIAGGPAGSTFSAIAIGDVNGDGRPDVVVGADYQGMQVFLQAADGSLVAGDFLNYVHARALRIADIDGDGRMELLAVSVLSSTVDIWHQDANGHLFLQRSLDFGVAAGYGVVFGTGYGLEVGDVNGDGLPDIVVTIAGAASGKNVAVFLAQPGGAFAAPIYLAADPTWGATGVAIGDVNGDGRNDIVVSTGGNQAWIGIYYQAPDGSLGPMVAVPTYDIPDALRIADINGDGRADIVVMHGVFSAVGVYLQQADGTLAPETLYDAPNSASGADAMVVGDINRDLRPDILYGGELILQKPVATFAPAAARPGTAAVFAAPRADLSAKP